MDLKHFYNSNAKDEFIAFADEYLKEYAAKLVLERKDVSGIADAHDILKGIFSELKKKYELKEIKKVVNQHV